LLNRDLASFSSSVLRRRFFFLGVVFLNSFFCLR
jgi:hypothetical protein